MIIKRHKSFLKDFKKLSKKLQLKTIERVELFQIDPIHPTLNNHGLAGRYKGFRSINITGDIRLIFKKLKKNTYEIVEFARVGSHSQVYK